MKILFAADGSSFTKKALAFLVTNDALLAGGELVVLHVNHPLPPRVRAFLDPAVIAEYHAEEAGKVLAPIEEFLKRHPVQFRLVTAIGHAAEEIVAASQREGAHLVVMGTHGYGVLGRTVMGSVATKVVAAAEVPVLLVK